MMKIGRDVQNFNRLIEGPDHAPLAIHDVNDIHSQCE
jgi:hypothetical protein